MNKKWFKRVSFDDEGIKIEFLYSINKEKQHQWSYSQLEKIIYYGYMMNTPSHCKVISKDKSINRFNCSKKEVDNLFKFIKSKGVKIEYYTQDTNQYRK